MGLDALGSKNKGLAGNQISSRREAGCSFSRPCIAGHARRPGFYLSHVTYYAIRSLGA